jgi:imidazolonepropionase-like amidohydrolase
MPGNANVIGGRTAVVKVGTGGEFRLLAADAGLKVSFVESAYPEGRPPTSVLGALAAIRDAEGDLAAELSTFGKGAKPVFVAASTNREVMLAAGLRGDLGFRTVLVADQNCGLFSKALQDGVAGVILDALVLNRQPFERSHLNDLMATNLPIAFATWAPFKSPGSLRLSAAIAARLGLPADRVLNALTLDAAKVLGVDAQIGSLKAGKDADLIVLSAPITDARARLLLCVQDGKVVFRAKKEGSS